MEINKFCACGHSYDDNEDKYCPKCGRFRICKLCSCQCGCESIRKILCGLCTQMIEEINCENEFEGVKSGSDTISNLEMGIVEDRIGVGGEDKKCESLEYMIVSDLETRSDTEVVKCKKRGNKESEYMVMSDSETEDDTEDENLNRTITIMSKFFLHVYIYIYIYIYTLL